MPGIAGCMGDDGGTSSTSARHADIELLDLVEGGDTIDFADGPVVEGATSHLVNAVVKMKLSSFLRDGVVKCALVRKINAVVLDGNVLLGEAYAFANFHIIRLLDAECEVPVIDRSFYYRCLLAVSDFACSTSTLDDGFKVSLEMFDRLRPPVMTQLDDDTERAKKSKKRYDTNPDGKPKVDIKEYNQMIASLSIQMATMASNHLLTNLKTRVTSFLNWKHPNIKRFHRAIVRAVLETPKIDTASVMMAASMYKTKKAKAAPKRPPKTPKVVSVQQQNRDAKAASEGTQRDVASQVAEQLRSLLPLDRPLKFASHAHKSLKLYRWLLKETEAGKAAHALAVAARIAEGGPMMTKSEQFFKGRLFTLLPMKNGFTTSSIPISAMFFLRILKSMKLSSHAGDGRCEDSRALWVKYANVKLVETANRKFAESITTDGYSVSALVQCKVSLDVTKGPSDSTIDEIRSAIKACDSVVRYGGIDPGFTDVVSGSYNDGKHVSYSSSRYYERSKVKYSSRRTQAYNQTTSALTDIVRADEGGQTASFEKMQEFARGYLGVLRQLLVDRMQQKYRKLRFLRHVSKQAAVQEIVDLLVGDRKAKTLTVIGFGDWSGGSKSPISRKHAGPIQMIKDQIGRRPNAVISPVDEHNSSKLDSNTWLPLTNMRAKETKRKKRSGDAVTLLNQRVHKVLHCKPSEGRYASACKETTWNRDVNAARNILMLLRMEIMGYTRPAPFCRKTFPPPTPSTNKSCP